MALPEQNLPLADIHLQTEPSLFPLSLWGNLLILIIFLVLVLAGILFYRVYRKNRVRKTALQTLSKITSGEDLGKVNTLLKRVALSYCGRRDVASLTGHEWFAYLDARLPEKKRGFCEQEKIWIEALYRGSELNPDDFNRCKALARTWIKNAKFVSGREQVKIND